MTLNNTQTHSRLLQWTRVIAMICFAAFL